MIKKSQEGPPGGLAYSASGFCAGNCVLLAVIACLFSSPVSGARLYDYTHRAFTLSGGLGLRYEDYVYDYDTTGKDGYSRQTLEEELRVAGTGFVWDPRFLLFDAGVTLRNRDTDYNRGDSEIDTAGYHLITTWFREKNPFVLFARKNTNNYSPQSGPAYKFTTSNYGFRWRFAPPVLGAVRLGYEKGHTKSDNFSVLRMDEQKDSFFVNGKRTFGKVYETHSVFNYGYRYDDSVDDASGRSYRQQYWHLQDSTRFSDNVNLRAGFTYYDRSDELIAQSSGNTNEIDSSHANLNVGLNVTASEKLGHFYDLAVAFNDVNDSEINSYNIAAGANYRVSPNWSSKGVLRFIATSNDTGGAGSSGYDRTAWGADAGVSYTRTQGILSTRAGYDLGLEIPQASDYSEDTIVNHSLSAGYTGRWSPVFSDALNYRLNYQTGSRYESADRKRTEHNLNYTISSRLSGGDSIRTVLNYRDWEESSRGPAGLDNSQRTLRGDVTWNHRFWMRHTLVMSVGAGDTSSGSGNGNADYSFWYSQARVVMTPWRRLKFTAMARYEERSGETSNLGPKLTLETNLNYIIAKWRARLQYRYLDADYETAAYQNSWLTLYLTRDFGIRF